MSTPAEARPAATVVVIRPGSGGFEVLLVRRNDRVAFMGGAFVFPGGRVDPADREIGGNDRLVETASRFPDLTVQEEIAFRRAAVRELQEEADLTVTMEVLIPFAHWVTPEVETRRYDTRFFLTVMPEGQLARHDDGELTELVWCTPTEALERGLRGDIMLPPPTWTSLRQIERHATPEAAIAWASAVRIVRVQPNLLMEGQTRILTLPGDPTFPAIPGWVVPDETRFVLEEGGGWLPVRC